MSIFDAIGSFLGFSDNGQGAAQKQQQQQQALQNQYGAQGAQIYAGLANQGNQQYGQYQGNYLNLLNDYAALSGLGSSLINTAVPLSQQQIQTAIGPTQAPTGQPTGTPQQTNNFQTNPGNFNGNTGPWANAGRAPITPQGILNRQGTGNLPVTQQSPNGTNQGNNPYQLDQYQQQQLNQSTALIAQSQQQAQAAFAQHMAAAGINDPRALEVGQQQLSEHFAALTAQTQTQFYEQVKQDKLKAMQEILAGVSQYGQQGIGEQEAAGTGYLGLASGAQAAANASAINAQNAQAQNNAQTSGILDLIGFGLGGGFGGAGSGSSGQQYGYDPGTGQLLVGPPSSSAVGY